MIIALSGKLGSGKTYISEQIIKKTNFTKFAFGDILKEHASKLANTDISNFYTQEGKNKIIDNFHNVTHGELLQLMGDPDNIKNTFLIDYMKDYNIHKLMWNDMNEVILKGIQNDNIIIDDLRFKHEANTLKSYKATIIRITFDETKNKTRLNSNRNLNHISETDLDDYNFDYYIKNDYNDSCINEILKLI